MKKTVSVSILMSIFIIISLTSCSSHQKKVMSSHKSKKVATATPKESVIQNDNNNVTNNQVVQSQPATEQEAVTQNQPAQQIEQQPVTAQKLTIVIDPGHGKGGNSEMELESPDSDVMKIKDGGGAQGVSTGVPEYVVTMQVALKLKSLLEAKDINVIMTKTDINQSPGNIDRAQVGNDNNAALEIRIHCDSAENSEITGASMLVPAPKGYAINVSAVSRQYGQTILNSLVTSAQMNNRGVNERSDLTGFNWSKVPIVLVEMGFMSNPNEDQLLTQDDYQNKLAQGLCKGILAALNQ